MDIDIVIPYVDCEDPQWEKGFEETLSLEIEKSKQDPSKTPHGIEGYRYRSFGTFKYLLRGIECCCPWVRRIYIVLQQPSQNPNWIKESDKLKIVYHQDIIPQEYLPTYNSATIEMFVWRIRGLSEYFIYINDDTFPIRSIQSNQFFNSDGVPKITLYFKEYKNIYGHIQMLKNSEMTAIMASGKDCEWREDGFLKDTHTWTPMKRSTWRKLFDEVGETIYSSLTPFRNAKNIVQQLSTYYFWFTKKYELIENPNNICMNFITFTEDNIIKSVKDKLYDIICINDIGVQNYEETKQKLINAFECIFPNKSQFEL